MPQATPPQNEFKTNGIALPRGLPSGRPSQDVAESPRERGPIGPPGGCLLKACAGLTTKRLDELEPTPLDEAPRRSCRPGRTQHPEPGEVPQCLGGSPGSRAERRLL